MLIRTQDKEELVNMDRVFAIGITNGGLIQAPQNIEDDHAIDLGKYSSKEKALKVLDMIEDAYEKDGSLFCNTYGNANTKQFYEYYTQKIIFQMPQSEEMDKEVFVV